jgi:7-cyano-7-deazaguanine tRNA-ribosyltransferase
MNFKFEVRETDLLARNGLMTVNGRRFETPCLLPVIHPVSQIISTKRLHEMGFEALMTNALIIHQRLKEKALERGIHALLDYDGALMTDSGGYQVLEYGSVEITNHQIAEFQSLIGSDLAVTLDRPTGYSRSVSYAKATMEYSLSNALETISEYRTTKTVWVGPVQGGLFPRLLARSSRGLASAGFRFLALGSPTPVMENYHFDELVTMIMTTRRNIPYSMPLHLFGAGHPLTMALSIALGSDTFDSASYILFARVGRYMTERGILELSDMQYLPCNCPSCNSTSANELKIMPRADRTERLALHNLYLLRKELMNCKQAISEGRLWDVVEERAASHPSVHAAFLEITKNADALEAGTPLIKERGLMLRSRADLARPELRIASRRLGALRSRRAHEAIIVICPDGMPTNLVHLGQRTRKRIERGELDLYRLHPQLGPYPAELDFVYPFTQTVQEEVTPRKESVDADVRRLKVAGYAAVRVLRDLRREARPISGIKNRQK